LPLWRLISVFISPSGATINANSGVFTWTPTREGTFDLIVKVIDDELSNLYDLCDANRLF